MKEINIGQATALTSPDPLVLVCTKKEDGKLNMAPVSFFMYASFNPPMLAFAMGKAANSGENIRRTGKAVLAAPGVSLKDAVCVLSIENPQNRKENSPLSDREIPIIRKEHVESFRHFPYLIGKKAAFTAFCPIG